MEVVPVNSLKVVPVDSLEVVPVDTVEDLLSWPKNVEHDTVCDWVLPLQSRTRARSLQSDAPSSNYKTLICHDMQGGYLDDRFCDGTSNMKAYQFYNWFGIDMFVYFSHHFITIPPCGWIHAAHEHGVQIFGTIMTEREAGAEIWDQILDSEETTEQAIDQIVRITSAFNLDGWLVNIECSIQDKVEKFRSFLTRLVEKIHLLDAAHQVIWYDSITESGKLNWQNQLNYQNQVYFDICDGIFLNYHWSEYCLIDSKEMAGDRFLDVYVGIDAYGRGNYGGGGFGIPKALDMIRNLSMSVAIFAQGWTYEVLGNDNFFANENKLWRCMTPYMLFHGLSSLPIRTSFSQGFGLNLYEEGNVQKNGPWYHLRKQQIQPMWPEIDSRCTMLTQQTSDVYDGGSMCSIWVDSTIVSFRLLFCEVKASDVSQVYLTYSFTSPLVTSVVLQTSVLPADQSHANSRRRLISTADTKNVDLAVYGKHKAIRQRSTKQGQWIIDEFVLPPLDEESTILSFGIETSGPGVLRLGRFDVT